MIAFLMTLKTYALAGAKICSGVAAICAGILMLL